MRMPVSDGGRSRRRNAGPGASGDESRHALGRRSHAKIPYVRQGTLPSVELWQQIRLKAGTKGNIVDERRNSCRFGHRSF